MICEASVDSTGAWSGSASIVVGREVNATKLASRATEGILIVWHKERKGAYTSPLTCQICGTLATDTKIVMNMKSPRAHIVFETPRAG